MIEFHRRRSLRGSLELTPLIDVVFQLLVFFLLTSAFIDPGVPLDLPGAKTAETPRDTPVLVSVTADGIVHVGSDSVAIDALPSVLERALNGQDEKRVAVRGDVAARYGLFMRVVDACRQVGVGEVVLASEPDKDEVP